MNSDGSMLLKDLEPAHRTVLWVGKTAKRRLGDARWGVMQQNVCLSARGDQRPSGSLRWRRAIAASFVLSLR